MSGDDYSNYHIGVFDSGLGGYYVSSQIKQHLPGVKVTTLTDQKNIPYGRKTPQQMLACIEPFMLEFEALGVDLIVIACNTCFMNLDQELVKLTSIPLIGYRPALEIAASQTTSGIVAVTATAGTLKSNSWRIMKAQYPKLEIIDIDCTAWVPLIESKRITPGDIDKVLQQALSAGADNLVLGCTHYNWLVPEFKKLMRTRAEVALCEATPMMLEKIANQLSLKI